MADQQTSPVHVVLKSSLLAEEPDLIDIVREFVNTLQERIDELRQALASSDSVRLARLAHQLKGAGGSYGYPEITELAIKLEQCVKSAQLADCQRLIAELGQMAPAAQRGLSRTP